MSDRERWIVYPLLFLALGVSLRDKLTQVVRCEELICKQLIVVDRENRPVLVAAADNFADPSAEKDATRATTGVLQIVRAQGADFQAVATLAGDTAGGFVSLTDPRRSFRVQVGHFTSGLGLRAVGPEEQLLAPFPFLFRPQPRPQLYTNPLGEPPSPESGVISIDPEIESP
jgi:hypothetical protein